MPEALQVVDWSSEDYSSFYTPRPNPSMEPGPPLSNPPGPPDNTVRRAFFSSDLQVGCQTSV